MAEQQDRPDDHSPDLPTDSAAPAAAGGDADTAPPAQPAKKTPAKKAPAKKAPAKKAPAKKSG